MSIKWWDEDTSAEKAENRIGNQFTHTLAKVDEAETKLNRYGFLYIPKNVLASLPFKPGDKLHLKIDQANKTVVLTSEDNQATNYPK